MQRILPLGELSYDYIPPTDQEYTGSRVRYSLDIRSDDPANQSQINGSQISFYIDADTKEVVTQNNPEALGVVSSHTVLTGDLDMDTVTEPGEYSYTRGTATLTNAPTDVDEFGFEVISMSGSEGGDIRQWLTHVSSFSTITYERARFEDGWRGWRRVQFVPTDGVQGQVLTKTGTSEAQYGWRDVADSGLASVATDATISGDGTSGSPLSVVDSGGSGGTGDTIQIAGLDVQDYWSGTIDVTSDNEYVGTGLTVPADERTGYWRINFGSAKIGANAGDYPSGTWHVVDVAQLFALPASTAGAHTSSASAVGLTFADVVDRGVDGYLAHTASGEILFATQFASSDANPLTIRREVYSASANQFTDADKAKLDGIEESAEVNVQANWTATTGDGVILNKPTIPQFISLSQADYDALTEYVPGAYYLTPEA